MDCIECSLAAENISALPQSCTAEDTILELIIDDNVSDREHRHNFFLEDITHVACGTASHRLGTVAVFDMCHKTGGA